MSYCCIAANKRQMCHSVPGKCRHEAHYDDPLNIFDLNPFVIPMLSLYTFSQENATQFHTFPANY